MPNHLSILGIIHTAISILALFAGFYALYSDGKINPANVRGKLYIILTIVTCLTSLPIMKTGHPTAGHYLAVVILVLLPIGIYARWIRILGKSAEYIQTMALSTTLFFSMVPAIVETLTRLPISKPIAASPDASIVQMLQLLLVVLYVTGVGYQFYKIHKSRKTVQPPDSAVGLG